MGFPFELISQNQLKSFSKQKNLVLPKIYAKFYTT